MSSKEKSINKLRTGYSPIELSPKAEITSIYKSAFKPHVDRKDLTFFFELHDTNEVILRAWSFLGLYHILEKQVILDINKESKIQDIILDILKDKREIKYHGGSSEIQISLREHHVRRICELDNALTFKPVYEYCKSFEGEPDDVIIELIEKVLSKSPNPSIEPLILHQGKNISSNDFNKKMRIINAFENLGQCNQFQEPDSITEIFKNYINEIEKDKNHNQELIIKKRELQRNIIRVAAVLNIDLEEETLKFVDSLTFPYRSLNKVAENYKNNSKFKELLLKKLKESNNSRFITEILKSILVLKDNIENWQDLIIEHIRKFQISDGSLIAEMQEADLISEDMILDFLAGNDSWSLEFVREFIIYHPEILDKWKRLKDEFITILQSFDNISSDKQKKELILKLIIDLKKEDLVKYCLDNFKNLEDEQLRKVALFPILKFGEESILLELKKLMMENEETAKFVKQFWERLERNDWRFFY